MILYQLVTGRLAWEDESKREGFSVASYLKEGRRPVLPDFVPTVYRDLIQACWAEIPSERPSFRDIVEETKDETLCFPECDTNEFLDYQREVLAKLGDRPRKK
jgi:hypothetical protein